MEQALRRSLSGPQLELPFGLGDQHLETADRQASGFPGRREQRRDRRRIDEIEHDRLIAEELVKTTGCDVNTRMNKLGTDLRSVWRRAFRYRAEREASANALRVREGKPIETASRCSDGGWTFDGTTLRFSRQIANLMTHM